jgi:diaminopimelate epimerase
MGTEMTSTDMTSSDMTSSDMTGTVHRPHGTPHAPASGPRPLLTVGKYHGLGNDFLVVIDPPVEPDGALARSLCDRHLGVGADGLIVGRMLEGPSMFRAAEMILSFQLFNADGSEAEMSGNGMRCLAQAALDAGLVGVGVSFGVRTPAGRREVVIERAGSAIWASVEMGSVRVQGAIGVGADRLFVDVGNPHLVVAGPDPSTVEVTVLGPQLEASQPAGLNVEFVTAGPGPDEVTMRVWERGVGETQACGTGACAAAVAFHHWGRVGPSVTVHQPGGSVAVEIEPDGQVRLSGPSELIATCEVSAALLAGWAEARLEASR